MGGILQVSYTCDRCGLVDVPVTVRHRLTGEDLDKWMNEVSFRLAVDHQVRSPHCRITALTNAKIPVQNEEEGIGFPSK